ncbi:type VII secretion target [Mycobacterium sp. C3-094]
MEALDVCGEGLQALAGQCSVDAERLLGLLSIGMTGPPQQATSLAVSHAYAATTSAAAMLAGRVQATADKLNVAATQYSKTDEASGQRLSALRIEP